MKKELETLIQGVRIYSDDIGMESDIEKCDKLIMKSEKRHKTKGIELQNERKIRTLGEKETYNHRVILEAYTTKKAEMNKKN